MTETVRIKELNVDTRLLIAATGEDVVALIRGSSSQQAIDSAAAAALSASDAADSADAAETSATAFTAFKAAFDAKQGRATLVDGTAEVLLASVAAGSHILLTSNSDLVVGALRAAITAGVKFVITSSEETDAGAVSWFIANP